MKEAREHDEQERAALVPQPPPCPTTEHGGGSTAAVDQAEQGPPRRPAAKPWRLSVVLPTRGVGLAIGGLVVLVLLIGTTTSGWINVGSSSLLLSLSGSAAGPGRAGNGGRPSQHAMPPSRAPRVPITFTCSNHSTLTSSAALPATCRRAAAAPSPSPSATTPSSSSSSPPRPCPDYFRYIHSDLSPWREAGITREAVERGRGRAMFRLVIVGGRAFVEKYRRSFQTRDVFTLWGVLQLLARYPGRVPDLDLMFYCDDIPPVRAAAYRDDPSAAPPVFVYCKDDASLGVVFPDWTFWGWPEVNIRPWAPFLGEVAQEARRRPWPDREPYAFWKGNPTVNGLRGDLMRCNASTSASGNGTDWKARVFRQDWKAAIRNGFRDSNPARQCAYRYRIYVQGRGWSVSQKYILSCGSPTLLVDSPFRDFASRGLVAGRHYWPVHAARMCPAIRSAVGWGNAHPAEAQRMGEAGAAFVRDDLAMGRVYDYMLHALTSYARLLRYTPAVPERATEICLESMACRETGRAREFMMESMERYVAEEEPCTLPPPFTADEAAELARREEEVRANVKRIEEAEETESKNNERTSPPTH